MDAALTLRKDGRETNQLTNFPDLPPNVGVGSNENLCYSFRQDT
jgi:hypothetical protein